MMQRIHLSRRRKRDFQRTVYSYYERHGRCLPWRKTADPYKVLVSEVMLQQTQVPRVTEKFGKFIDLFPDPAALAGASLQAVLLVWQGMGYNRRALALKKAAGIIVSDYKGTVPSDEESLLSLPGIGIATARAIQAFAFNRPVVLIETNIRAVMIHHFLAAQGDIPDSCIHDLAEQTLDRTNPRTWYNALMDYGTFLKKLYGNPARKSARHRLQPPFEGSNRQIRGAVVKILLRKDGCTESELARELSIDADLLAAVIGELEAEGLIANCDGCIGIAEGPPE